MTDIWEDARQAWLRSERGDYGHYDDRKINAAISRGRELEAILAKANTVAARIDKKLDRVKKRVAELESAYLLEKERRFAAERLCRKIAMGE